jgi:HSP20 family molecular chaperone IbpA
LQFHRRQGERERERERESFVRCAKQFSRVTGISARKEEREREMSRHPEILWAQRSDKLYVTVELPDAKDAQVKLEADGRFLFSATVGSDNEKFETDLELFGKVDVEHSKINQGLRHTFCEIDKGEKGWWTRLLKNEGKAPPYVRADWNRWIDEDEEEQLLLQQNHFHDFNMNSIGDFNSGFDATADDEGDSDDDESDLPDMSKAEI